MHTRSVARLERHIVVGRSAKTALLGLIGAVMACITLSGTVSAQQVPPQNSETGEVRVESTRFAPGTIRVIPPAALPEETFSGPLTLSDLIESNPDIDWVAPDFPEGIPYFDVRSRTLIEQARKAVLRREIFCLEFSFKPLRQVYVDIPQLSGRMERELVWYMVYRVRYSGGDLRAAKGSSEQQTGGAVDELYSRIEKVSYRQRRFFPLAILRNAETGQEYQNRVIPVATQQIQSREKISAKLHNAVEITEVPIPYSTDPAADGVWGVFTWTGVDPEIDFVSLYIQGLTNAFKRLEDLQPEDLQQDDGGGQSGTKKKVLQLNFYRPGDRFRETQDKIYFGIPAFTDPEEQAHVLKQFGLEKRLDYQWIYR